MAGKDLPLNGPSLAQGVEYTQYDPVTSDAADISRARPEHGNKPGARGAQVGTNPAPESPLDPVSLSTRAVDAPPFGTNLTTDRHDPNWLDRSKPHISPESQGKDLRRPTGK